MLKKINRKYIIGLLVVLAALLFFGFYWLYAEFYPSTDDAYVGANLVNVAPQVTGQVDKVYVSNNEHVSAGQLLFVINQQPFQIALENAQLQLAVAENQLADAKAQLDSAHYNESSKEAVYEQKQQFYQQVNKLYKKNYLSEANNTAAYSLYMVAKANLEQAKSTIQELENQVNYYNLQISVQKTNIKQALLDLQYTQVSAPFAGVVTSFDIRPGQIVTAAQPLFTLVDDSQLWVDANFKETQLERVRPGQKVTVHIDIYGDTDFQGVVNSISPASGAALSILPPENFSGNWVKVTQRIPVRIMLQALPSQNYMLPVGASAEVTINTLSK